MSYDPELPDTLNLVRFLIGDTEEPEEFTDEEITALIALSETLYGVGGWTAYLVAAQLLDSMVLSWTVSSKGAIEEEVSKLRIRRGEESTDFMTRMADRYRRTADQLMNNSDNAYHFKVLPE